MHAETTSPVGRSSENAIYPNSIVGNGVGLGVGIAVGLAVGVGKTVGSSEGVITSCIGCAVGGGTEINSGLSVPEQAAHTNSRMIVKGLITDTTIGDYFISHACSSLKKCLKIMF